MRMGKIIHKVGLKDIICLESQDERKVDDTWSKVAMHISCKGGSGGKNIGIRHKIANKSGVH